MSNPTSNFGWQMPTPTDLVTDLPADFEVFGQAVDTSLADLKGGTTGQVLSKATNTDMDFTWVSPNPGDITAVNVTSPITGGGSSGDVTIGIQAGSTTQSGAVQLTDSTSSTSTTTAATPNAVKTSYDLANAAIPKSTATAKGNIFTATAASTPAVLAVGTNGQTLVADSTASTGLKWETPSSGSYTLLSSGNLPTAANTVTISSLSTAYQDLVIEIYGVTFGTAAGYGVLTGGTWGRGSGTILNTDTSTGAAYSGTYPRFVDKTWTTQTANTMTIRVFNYSATYRKAYAYWGFLTDSSTTWGTTAGGGVDTATAISSITIYSIFGGSPNFTGGSYKIWGVK